MKPRAMRRAWRDDERFRRTHPRVESGPTRPDWGVYALELAAAARIRCEDPYVQVGAVVLRSDMSVAGVGYNGAPPGVEIDWSDREGRRPLVIHAEVNALRYCRPSEVTGGLMAVTGTPCPSCLTSVAAHGIQTVIFDELLEGYPLEDSQRVADALGIDLFHAALARLSR